MLSIKEMVDKTENQRKDLSEILDRGYYDHDERNIFGTGYLQDKATPLGAEDAHNIQETLKTVTLAQLLKRGAQELNLNLKEFLAKSSVTGAAYLIPDKIYGVMFESAKEEDIVAEMSITMIPADQLPGTTCKVDVEVDESLAVQSFKSGGTIPVETIKTVQPTLDFSSTYGIHFRITNDLIEDSQFNLIEMHARNAGREMGEFATNLACIVMKAAADGDGDRNIGAATGNTNETLFRGGTTYDVQDCITANLADGYLSDTMVTSAGAMLHSILFTVSGAVATTYYGPDTWITSYLQNGLPTKMAGMNCYYTECSTMTNSKAGTALVTLVFSKNFSMVSGRKRWLRIENYSDPIRDLVGAAVTMRQDSVTIYDDSIAYIYET